MKKIISAILALSCVLCLFASCKKEAEVLTSGDYNYIVLEDGTAKITKYIGTSEEIEKTVPSQLDGKDVTVIGAEAFKGAQGITVLYFPDELLEIEAHAFEESSVKKAFMNRARNLKKIGESAFYKCENLVQADMPASLEAVEAQAFGCCPRLKVATFRGNDAKIDDFAFDACPKLTVYAKEGMKSIEMYALTHNFEFKYIAI